jgi:Ca2+-binding RTX toxin-like protein
VGNELANTLTGSETSNWLLGGAGNDLLNGKGGNDVLFGEASADIFVFETGTGGDTIGDFAAGTDRIDLSAFGFTSFAQVQAAMIENGGTTAIILGNDFVVLNGVAKTALHAGDFILSGGNAAEVQAGQSMWTDAADDAGRGHLLHDFQAPMLSMPVGELYGSLM